MPMETEEILEFKSESPSGTEGNELCGSGVRPVVENAPHGLEDEEGLIRDELCQSEGKVEDEQILCTLGSDLDKDLVGGTSTAQANVKVIESIEVLQSSQVLVENGFAASEDSGQKMSNVRDGNSILILCLV